MGRPWNLKSAWYYVRIKMIVIKLVKSLLWSGILIFEWCLPLLINLRNKCLNLITSGHFYRAYLSEIYKSWYRKNVMQCFQQGVQVNEDKIETTWVTTLIVWSVFLRPNSNGQETIGSYLMCICKSRIVALRIVELIVALRKDEQKLWEWKYKLLVKVPAKDPDKAANGSTIKIKWNWENEATLALHRKRNWNPL